MPKTVFDTLYMFLNALIVINLVVIALLFLFSDDLSQALMGLGPLNILFAIVFYLRYRRRRRSASKDGGTPTE
jgi:uncharacterized MnhB-related membrane protein